MKKLNRKMVTMIMLVLMLVVAAVPVSAASLKLSKKSATLKTGQSITLQIKGSKKKAKWTTSNKTVAAVSQKGKVTAKKAGKATITAKIGSKKLTCKVTVVAAKKTAASGKTSNTTNSTAAKTTNPTIYYKGQKTENGIAYNVVADSKRNMKIYIKNYNANAISLGWVNDFYITVTTNQGKYTFPLNNMQTLINTGRTNFKTIVSGGEIVLEGNNLNMAGVPQAVTVHNIYPLNANGLPIQKIDWSADFANRIKTITYTTTIYLS